jgi:hypothetical protein
MTHRPFQPGLGRLAVVGDGEAVGQEQRHGNGDCARRARVSQLGKWAHAHCSTKRTGDGDEPDQKAVDGLVLVREGVAGVLGQAVGVVGHHGDGRKQVGQLGAVAREAAAVAHGRAVAAVRPRVQDQLELRAAVHSLRGSARRA